MMVNSLILLGAIDPSSHIHFLQLICSTEEVEYDDDGTIKDSDKKGFYGVREVEGGNTVCTTIHPLKLKWRLFDSHKTRYTQFRGVIQYDRNSDQVLLSDKSKSLSDDRDLEPTLRFSILKLTFDYFGRMRAEYGDYQTDKKKLVPEPQHPVVEPESQVVAPESQVVALEPPIAALDGQGNNV